MSMLYVLIPLALGLLGLAVWALLWAIKSGQFDDLESHGWSVVLDDDQRPMPMVDDPTDDEQADNANTADKAVKAKNLSTETSLVAQEGKGGEPVALNQENVSGSTDRSKNSNTRRSSE